AEDGIRDPLVTGVQTCALPISNRFPESSNKFSCELTFFSYCARIFLPKMLAFWSTASLCGIISFQFSLEGFAASTTNTRYRGARSEELRVGKEDRSEWKA